MAYTSDASGPSDPAVTTVVVEGDPGPGPGPGPTPPDPVPPVPTDPWISVFKAAYDKESAADKAKKAQLASLYKQAAATTVFKTELTTMQDLRSVVSEAINAVVGTSSLTNVRRAIADELNKILPSSPTAQLDDDTRKKLRDTFNRVATVLEAVK